MTNLNTETARAQRYIEYLKAKRYREYLLGLTYIPPQDLSLYESAYKKLSHR